MPRRGQWGIAALCVLVGGLVLGLVILGRDADPVAATTSTVATQLPTSLSAELTDTPAVQQAEPDPALASSPDPTGADQTQVCSGAWVRVQDDGSIDQGDVRQVAELLEARERVLAVLRSDPNDLARAAALWFVLLGNDEAHRHAVIKAATSCTGADCRKQPRARPDFVTARETLARLAASSVDARTYGLAFNVCGGRERSAGACRMLSAEQWARLDPGNASPWWFILAAASERNDAAGRDEALHRIATAVHSNQSFYAIPALIANAAPPDETSKLAAWAMSIEAVGAQSSWSNPGYRHLKIACKGTALADANRRQNCGAIANLLVDHSDTLIERMLGTEIGRELGWPAQRIDQLRGEYSAHIASQVPTGATGRRYDCPDIQRDLTLVQRHAITGEAGALRFWVARSRKTPAEFAQEERARQQQTQE